MQRARCLLVTVALLVGISTPVAAYSQEVAGGAVEGNVTDAWTGEPIMDGRVAISPWDAGARWKPVGTAAFSDGEYRFSNLEAGQYRVLATSRGYLAYYSDPFWLEPGQALTIDLAPVPAYGTPFATVGGVVCEVEASTDMCMDDGEESTVANVSVEARRPMGSLLGATTTDRWGWFRLDDLAHGTIVVSLAPAPPGMTLVDPVQYTLGRNESAFDAELKIMRVDTHLALDSSIAPQRIAPGEEATLVLVAIFQSVAPSVAPFEVTGVEVAVHLPPDVVYVGHTGEGRFDPGGGLWTIDELPFLGQAHMTITVSGTDEAVRRLHAEVAASDWPDVAATYGDGRGDDYTEVSMEVLTPAPVDQAVIGGIVWLDEDGDGTKSSNEPGLDGVKVTAALEGAPALAVVTGADGAYRFAELPAGVYRVSLQPSSLPEDVAAPETSYVLTLGADSTFLDGDFACAEVGGASAWWFFGGGATVVLLGIGLLAGWLYQRRRGTADHVHAEPTLENVPV